MLLPRLWNLAKSQLFIFKYKDEEIFIAHLNKPILNPNKSKLTSDLNYYLKNIINATNTYVSWTEKWLQWEPNEVWNLVNK